METYTILHADGQTVIVGVPNYTNTEGVEIRLADGTYEWVTYDEIDRVVPGDLTDRSV